MCKSPLTAAFYSKKTFNKKVRKMKKVLPCLLLAITLFNINALAQHWEIGTNFNYAKASGRMAQNIDDAFGMSFDFSRQLKTPFAIGAQLGIATYGSQKTRQSYTFDDGSVTETNVFVNNNILNFNLTGRYFLRNTKKLNPYLSGKLGWAWFKTTLTIEDPSDNFSCHPLESDVLAKDNTYIASIGAGLRVDLGIFSKKLEPKRFYIDFNTHFTQGGTVRYMNAETTPSHHHDVPNEDVMARFINTQTQVIHEHHVGYLYRSMISMIEYRLGIIHRLGATR
jgi:hypothetical protein